MEDEVTMTHVNLDTQPVADFGEPVEFGWTEAGYEVGQALTRYSEATHADPSDIAG
jgi:hypothetical protein